MALEEQPPAPTREQMAAYIEAVSQTAERLVAQLDAVGKTIDRMGALWKEYLSNGC